MLARYALLAVALASQRDCRSAPPPPARTEASSSASAIAAAPLGPLIEAKHVSTRGVRFDVVLRNERDAPRWFVLPDVIDPIRSLGPVSYLQRTELVGEGKVVIGRAQLWGGSFNIVRLPARGTVTLRGLRYSTFTAPLPPTVEIELITATDVHLGDESIASWFEIDPTASPGAVVEDDRDPLGKHELPAHDTQGREMAVHITEDRHLKLRVAIDPAAGSR
jgi:hypothetical protein